MKAIVYLSGTGFTKRYAEMLSSKTGLPCYDLKTAQKEVKEGEEIYYLGWVYANTVKGLSKAQKRWKLAAVSPVGMYPESPTNNDILKSTNKLTCPMFYLQGGMQPDKIKGVNKLILKMVCKFLTKDEKPENADIIKTFREGCDCVSEENLAAALTYIMMES